MRVDSFSVLQQRYWQRAGLARRRPPEHPVVAAYVTPKIELIRRYIEIGRDTCLLDVGCGNGFFTHYFDKICKTCGVDLSEQMLAMNPVGSKIRMSADELTFRDHSFDIVFCHDLLHHAADPDRVVAEMKRVSKRYVVLLESNRNNPFIFLFACMVKEERQCLKSSLSYLVRLAQQNGLRVIDAFSYGMVFPNKLPVFLIPLARWFKIGRASCRERV